MVDGALRYLLDTNTLSEPARQAPHPRVLGRMQAFHGEMCICAPVWNEALFGMRHMPSGRRRQLVQRYLETTVRGRMPILPYDAAAAEWHASERARLEAIGLTRPFIDGQIAAIAYTQNLTLVTSNTRDFAPFQGLRVEDWRD